MSLIETQQRPEIKAANLDSKFPRFRTARALIIGEDGQLHDGKRVRVYRGHTVGQVVDKLMREDVAGFAMPREEMMVVNGNPSDSPEGKITAHSLNRKTILIPFNPIKDSIIFPTSQHLPSWVKDRLSF